MEHLPYLACLSDPLVVWGPTALLLQTTSSFLEPRELLRIVQRENAAIRIIGREPWLLSKNFRNQHPWALARWTDFDEVVKDIALEDSSRPLLNRRVIIAPSEKGYAQADETLKSANRPSIVSTLSKLHRERQLPAGILEKADRAKAANQPTTRVILRDLYNHADAVQSASATVAATPHEHLIVLQQTLVRARYHMATEEVSGNGAATEADLREAAQLLRKVKPVLTGRELQSFLSSRLKSDLQELMYSPRFQGRLDAELLRKLQEATTSSPFLRRYFRLDAPVEASLRLGGLVHAFAGVYLTGKVQWGIVPIVVEALNGTLRKLSLIPETVQHGSKVQALFLLVFGTVRPTRRQIWSLRQDLSKET